MDKPLGPLIHKFIVSQIITPPVASIIESLYVRFGTFCRENKSHVCIKLIDGKEILQSWKIDCRGFSDNAYKEFLLDNPINTTSYPSIWKVEISCTAKEMNDGIALFYDDEKTNDSFYIDYRQVRGSLCMDFKSKPNTEDYEYNYVGKNGLISVIIPSYNCSEFIEDCINSVYSQTYNFVEVIVVDDGSDKENTKKTRLITSSFKLANDKLITLIEHSENKGASAARNTGAKLANGEFLFFLDSDTFLKSNAFELMINTLHSHYECSYAYCQFKWGDRIIHGSPFNKEKLKRCNFASMMSLIRTIDFPDDGLDESLLRYQDWDLWLMLLKKEKIGVWIEDCLFESAIRENSISSGGSISDQEARKILAKKHASWANISIF